jgi:hypothetical protein
MREPNQRLHHGGQELGRVLAVGVQHHDDVEIVLRGQLVAGLLVAAVAEVPLVPDHADRQVVRGLLVVETDQIGAVGAGVVADEDLSDLVAKALGDAVQGLGEGRRGVVGDDQHTDPRLAAERQL